MMRPLGHDRVLTLLEKSLPPATLLKGPRSVGKMTIAEYLAEHHDVQSVDLMRCPVPVRIDDVRRVIAFTQTASYGPYKLIIADLDGASDAALNSLLKTLEEPPLTVRFVLCSSQPVPATIESRAAVFALGLLSRQHVAAILMANAVPESAAVQAATLARGQVDVAMTVGPVDSARATVLTLVRALERHDRALFERTARSVDDVACQLLRRFLVEAITGNWSCFSRTDAHDLTEDRYKLHRMLLALNQLPRARPRLQVRVALLPFVLSG